MVVVNSETATTTTDILSQFHNKRKVCERKHTLSVFKSPSLMPQFHQLVSTKI